MTTETVTAILDERGSRYGSFADNARISQGLCNFLTTELHARVVDRNQSYLKPHQVEALQMIFHKIARILSGNPDYADNWIDIAGYAELGRNPR